MKTNRKKYLLDRDEYDLLMEISNNIKGVGTYCAIRAICGKKYKKKCEYIWYKLGSVSRLERDCGTCIQNWLNEESEG